MHVFYYLKSFATSAESSKSDALSILSTLAIKSCAVEHSSLSAVSEAPSILSSKNCAPSKQCEALNINEKKNIECYWRLDKANTKIWNKFVYLTTLFKQSQTERDYISIRKTADSAKLRKKKLYSNLSWQNHMFDTMHLCFGFIWNEIWCKQNLEQIDIFLLHIHIIRPCKNMSNIHENILILMRNLIGTFSYKWDLFAFLWKRKSNAFRFLAYFTTKIYKKHIFSINQPNLLEYPFWRQI